MAHNKDTHDDAHHDACCETASSVCQTLDELEFERGIWSAAMNGDVERVKTLLSNGASPNATDSFGYKPLHYAARNGHYLVCETLLQHGADVNAITRSVRATPLHRASVQGHTEVVDLLLDHGADANLRDADGKTPLHRVIKDVDVSKLDVCKLLAEVTDYTIKDNSGKSVGECFQQIVNDMTTNIGIQDEEISEQKKLRDGLKNLIREEEKEKDRIAKRIDKLQKMIEKK